MQPHYRCQFKKKEMFLRIKKCFGPKTLTHGYVCVLCDVCKRPSDVQMSSRTGECDVFFVFFIAPCSPSGFG